MNTFFTLTNSIGLFVVDVDIEPYGDPSQISVVFTDDPKKAIRNGFIEARGFVKEYNRIVPDPLYVVQVIETEGAYRFAAFPGLQSPPWL